MRRWLADAREAGAELAVVVTAPGTRSQENVMRWGFILLYTRIIFVGHLELKVIGPNPNQSRSAPSKGS